MNSESLTSLPLLANLETREQDLLASVLTERAYTPGQTVFHKGSKGFSCFLILEGSVDVRGDAGDRSAKLATLETGSIFGEVALLDHGRRSATCSAGDEGCRLAELQSTEFDMIFNAGNAFAYKLLDMIAVQVVRNLRNASAHLRDMAVQEAMARHHGGGGGGLGDGGG